MSKSSEIYARDDRVIAEAMKLRFFPISIARAEGATLIDDDGNEYLDFNSGWGMANVGYGNPKIVSAVQEQASKLMANCLISSTNENPVELAERLVELLPGDFEKKVWYGHSGSDANEFIYKAIPLATGRPRIMSFVGSYHGQTMGSYAMSGHPSQGQFISGGSVVKVPYPYCYRCPFGKDCRSCDLFCVRYIDEYVLKMAYDPSQVGAMIFEPVMSDGGDVDPPEGFFSEMEKVARKHGIWVVSDEVKVGFGRTGKMFGFQHYGMTPDAVVMGKPIAAGLPLSAVVGRKELMDAGHGIHMFTTAGDPVSTAAAIQVLKTIRDDNLVEHAREVGEFLKEGLTRLMDKYECIGDVRGRGMILGVEIVKDRGTKEPDPVLTTKIVYSSFISGMLYYYAGILENVLELTPPLVLTMEEAQRALEIMDYSIGQAVSGVITDEMVAGFTGWG